MKKVIAAAVAAAFVAPVYAADITVGGEVEYKYSIVDGSNDAITADETAINVSASEELDGGYTISASINLVDDDNAEVDTQGTALTLSGPHGSLVIGDASGALDATGDWTDIASAMGGFGGDGDDHALAWTLPSTVEGLTVVVSGSPNGSNNVGTGTGVADDASSVSVTYAIGDVSVYAGTQSAGDTEEMDAYGIKTTIGGVYLAYETADQKTSAAVDRSITGFAAKYSMGDTTFFFESQQNKQDSNATYTQKETVMGAEYNWGSNVDLYVAVRDSDEAKVSAVTDATVIGVEFAF
jgi:hypothetical protein